MGAPDPVKRIAWLLGVGLAVLALVLLLDVFGITSGHGGAPPTKSVPPGGTHPMAAAHGSAGSAGPGSAGPGSAPTPNSSRSGRRAQASFGPFRLVVHTVADTIDVGVAPFSAASYQAVDPPHNTAQQWDTAAWIVQSTYPARPARGTAYIYGHACWDIVCSFNDLKDTRVGDIAQIMTPTARLTYRVDRIGVSPKTASSLPQWASDSTIPNRLVLVTCTFESNGASLDNLVVRAHLVHKPVRARTRAS